MSGTIPPPPQGLPPPPRSVRALRIGAILVALFVVGTGIAGVVWWSLHSLGEQPGSKVIATTQGTGQGVSMADLLSSAPTGTEIPAANRRRQPASAGAADVGGELDAGLSSNLVVHTSKRTISISLTSHQREYMPLVALDIPEETESTSAVGLVAMAGGQQAVQTACDMAPSVPREQFSVRGDNVPWRPVDVYWVATPVGTKTCVDSRVVAGDGDRAIGRRDPRRNDALEIGRDICRAHTVERRRFACHRILRRFRQRSVAARDQEQEDQGPSHCVGLRVMVMTCWSPPTPATRTIGLMVM